MSNARRRAAARNGIATVVAFFWVAPAPVWAESGPQLILPLVTALAVASAAAKVPQQVAVASGRRPILSLIPSQVQFEDGYEIDVEDYIGRRKPVDVVDADRIVSFDVLPHRENGWMTSFVYDTETRGPFPHRGDDVLRFVFDYRF